MEMDVVKIKTDDNQLVTECRMDSGRLAVDLLSYGAAIHRIRLSGSNDSPASGSRPYPAPGSSPCPAAIKRPVPGSSLALSLDTVSGYRRNPLYAGATLAPNAGRISDGRLKLPQGLFPLTRNDGSHQLHGGASCLSFCNWDVTDLRQARSACTVAFCCHLSDGVDGYPGNRRFTVRYRLTDEHALMIRYEASSDCPTYINMANHAYFNLLGDFSVPVDDHQISVAASRYTELRPDHIPEKVSTCSGTPFDFSFPHSLSRQAKKYPRHPQLEIGRGYNHGFLLDCPCDFSEMDDELILNAYRKMPPSLTLKEPLTGRQMQVYTDAPCIVLYSGGFIGKELLLEDKIPSSDSCALAVECQDIPDTPNFAPEKMVLTTPERPFSRTVIYQFLP